MITLIFQGAVLVLVIGFIAKLILDRMKSEHRITNKEFAISASVLVVIVIPLIAYLGTKLSIHNQVTYHENWGGIEVNAKWVKTPCVRDGNMRHYYKGDPYVVPVPYECGSYQGEGKNRRYVSKTCYRNETRYHDIPYTTEEWTFEVETTLGTYVIADRNLPTDPNKYRYRQWVSVPDDLPSGIPQFWQEAKNRLDRGDPGPVTARRSYDNYILASQSTILKRFNNSVDGYTKAGMLPAINSNVRDFYYSDRVYPVGVSLTPDWQQSINRFDGCLGSTLQGDLHLVIVNANKVSNPDNYFGALMAYWQSKTFEKDALSKNGIVVVLGSKDGKTVDWARAGTGMPMGNEAMLLDIENTLRGRALNADSILGKPKAVLTNGKVQLVHTQGALEKVIWGDHAFKRVRMNSHEEDGSVGYTYLLRELVPTGWQHFWILFVTFVFGCGAWLICIFNEELFNRNN